MSKKEEEQRAFVEKYNEYSEKALLIMLLYEMKESNKGTQILINKSEKIRANTSNLVWWLIAIPLIIAAFVFFVGI